MTTAWHSRDNPLTHESVTPLCVVCTARADGLISLFEFLQLVLAYLCDVCCFANMECFNCCDCSLFWPCLLCSLIVNTDKDYYNTNMILSYNLLICYYNFLMFDTLPTSTTNNQLILINSKQ